MRESVLIERVSSADGDDVRLTAASDVPVEDELEGDVPQTGTVLDQRYEITGVLGQGGMGHVLSARHVVLGHRLAIKVLRREMTRDAEIVERFRREARAASAIGHLGIVAVKDFGTLPTGASYYVMEHVEGVGLADALHADRQFTIERAVDVVRQMADALGAAHAAGIVHRDVKPENVLLASFHGRRDHVKILDFGIAKLDFASRLSGAHRVLGTPAYMSPEQARGQALDHRCDVYALGILFYELLAGDVPFDDRRPLEVLRQQIHLPAPSILLLRPDAPEAIADVIARCLEKSPDARPASMRALAEMLESVAAPRGMGFALSSPSAPTIVASASVPVTPMPAAAATNLSVQPVPLSVRSRSTPISPGVAARSTVPKKTGASPQRGWTLALVAGLVLTVLGVVALAAAGGVLIRERSDDAARPVATAPPVAAPLGPVPVVPAVAPTPALTAQLPSDQITTPTLAASPTTVAHVAPMHPHAPHPSAVSSEPVVEPAPAPVAAPTDEHPAIRVIDPWE